MLGQAGQGLFSTRRRRILTTRSRARRNRTAAACEPGFVSLFLKGPRGLELPAGPPFWRRRMKDDVLMLHDFDKDAVVGIVGAIGAVHRQVQTPPASLPFSDGRGEAVRPHIGPPVRIGSRLPDEFRRCHQGPRLNTISRSFGFGRVRRQSGHWSCGTSEGRNF